MRPSTVYVVMRTNDYYPEETWAMGVYTSRPEADDARVQLQEQTHPPVTHFVDVVDFYEGR